ncbi:polymer-forming cytoskeletal [Oxobacter pfennigii]|uniref:Polymer-forming cytoskeletal n=1 Tax=Oxobacter pfennigii TaxID=36849 RepID=A0A0P8WDL6_9CLOT|nr:polymer-forming cytoskeletal protein [Oxobacter pfennigii]KPU46046.1 polymer-forming cytoskeletal [Oxobacter pfennigii]
MFNNKKNPQTIVDINPGSRADTTIIGANSSFEGKLVSTGIIRVDGQINGELSADESIIIGEGGSVKGNIKSKKVTIAGKVEGNVVCSDNLELTSNGKLYGDVEVKSINIEDGAVFHGKCSMMEPSLAIESGKVKLLPDDPAKNDNSSK